MQLLYQEVKGIYSFNGALVIIAIGLFCLLYDYPTLKKKKLKKEGQLCKYMGIAYIAGSIGLYVLFRIF